MLQTGQVIRYGPALYRVSYVNHCRALIVPLAKRHVVLADGREFDADRVGVNISPNSFVEIVTNVEAARDQLELEAVERELVAARKELAGRPEGDDVPKPAPAAKLKPVAHRKVLVMPGGGWFLKDVETPSFKEGTLAERVYLFIGVNPGRSTSEIVAGVGGEGAVAACVSRFHQSGLIEKLSRKD